MLWVHYTARTALLDIYTGQTSFETWYNIHGLFYYYLVISTLQIKFKKYCQATKAIQ